MTLTEHSRFETALVYMFKIVSFNKVNNFNAVIFPNVNISVYFNGLNLLI